MVVSTKGENKSKLLCVLILSLVFITMGVSTGQENQELYLFSFSFLIKTLVIGLRARPKSRMNSSQDPNLNHICKDPF